MISEEIVKNFILISGIAFVIFRIGFYFVLAWLAPDEEIDDERQ